MDDGFIWITTPERTALRAKTKVYPIGDLIKSTNVFNDSVQDQEWLIELIESSVAPSTWDRIGGPGRITFSGGDLIVSQTDDTLDIINSLLAKIRMLRDAPQDKPLPSSIPVDDNLAPADDATRARLHQSVSLHFIETPLNEVVEQLRTLLKIEIQLDLQALEDAGVGSDAPVTFSCRSLYADVALRQLLERCCDLRLLVYSEFLLITTPEVEVAEPTLRLYPVRDLIDPNRLGVAAYDELIEAMVSGVAKSTWDEIGDPGTIIPIVNIGALLVAQTEANHQKFAELVTALRANQSGTTQQPLLDQAIPVTKLYEVNSLFIRRVPDKVPAAKETPKPAGDHSNRPPDPDEIMTNYIELVQIIKECVEPDSWKSNNQVSIRIVNNQLMIRQRPIVHEKIKQLLYELRIIYPPNSGGMSIGGPGF